MFDVWRRRRAIQRIKPGDTEAHLYRAGRRYERARLPAVFPIEGGAIEVQMSAFGIRRCHFVADDGTEQQLVPDPRSAEGRRARLERERPGLSRVIARVSLVLILVPLILGLPQTVESISRFPPLTERFGVFDSPFDASAWLNIALAISATVGSTEHALRLKYNRWLDMVADLRRFSLPCAVARDQRLSAENDIEPASLWRAARLLQNVCHVTDFPYDRH
ncbi:hypothetical protein [Micromonospora matsumotoense]|uniref:hypothetical protein n=1 Tax=Micromonospora matsumotoense TaxID=121616 RepID=UPI003404CDDD